MTLLALLVAIAIALSLVMTGAWLIALRSGQSGWVDAIWSFATGGAGVAMALAPIGGWQQPTTRQLIVGALAALWSLRLGSHIVGRTMKGGDDPRYAQLRRDWGGNFGRRLFWFLQIQAASALLLVLTIAIAAHNPAPGLRLGDLLGMAILAFAIGGEAVADRQLTRFRAEHAGKGQVCDIGLWGYSRHPNYFFEWLGWLAYAAIAIDLTGAYPWGWVALCGPVFMYWLLVHVSGVPPLEAHMLRSRGDAFRDYQRRVNAFWPGPPARASSIQTPGEFKPMNLIASAINTVERAPLPDPLTRYGIQFLVGRTRRRLSAGSMSTESDFAREMARHPIATHVEAANEQHYELPPAFFSLALGPRRKYSSCFYDKSTETLEQAELRALEETVTHADLADGQRILELGCGWGSLTLYMAERYPRAQIVAVSNSAPQRRHIEEQARMRRLDNVRIVTADMNDFGAEGVFDRVVSVEMFEHMSNWKALLERVKGWLAPDGRLFLHVFTHRLGCYRFDHADKSDWIANHFFTGGIMPSHGLIRCFADIFEVEQEWRWNGKHYQRTAEDWLANFDANQPEIDCILVAVYGDDAGLWRRRWRLFFLATAGLFGHADGEEWGVSHYRLRPAKGQQS